MGKSLYTIVLDSFRVDFYHCTGRNEPPHVHVRHGDGVAKIWLTPVSLEWARWMKGSTERRALKFVNDNIIELLRAWEKHCTKR